jgi:hypothetical protein
MSNNLNTFRPWMVNNKDRLYHTEYDQCKTLKKLPCYGEANIDAGR